MIANKNAGNNMGYVKRRLALCIDVDCYPASLQAGKEYTVLDDPSVSSEMLRVIDESGIDYLFPARLFTLL